MELQLLTGCLGLFVGFFSGLLGIGGGILMAPLLLYIPGWIGLSSLPMRDIAGLTIVQGLAACLSGALTHKKFHFVSNRLTAWMGITIFLTALVGGAAAEHATNTLLSVVFALMSLLAALLIFIPPKKDSESPDMTKFTFSRSKAVLIAGAVGLTGGLVAKEVPFFLSP